MAFFNSKKYLLKRECADSAGRPVKCSSPSALPSAGGTSHTVEPSFPLVDGSDALANANQIITFYQVNGDRAIPFKAFITTYNETWNSDWTPETVYGRSDPIYMFKQNTRQITLAFKLPAASAGEAYENLTKVQRLVQFIYPSYSSVSTGPIPAQTISRSPLVRLNILGFTQKQLPNSDWRGITKDDPSGTPVNPTPLAAAGWNWAKPLGKAGILGAIANLNINYNLENTDYGVFQPAELNGTILPKLIEVNLSFNVIHEFTVGWGEEGNFASKTYPFNVDILDDKFYLNPPDQDATTEVASESRGQGDSLRDPDGTPIEDIEELNTELEALSPDQVTANLAASVDPDLSMQSIGDYRTPEQYQADLDELDSGRGSREVRRELRRSRRNN